MSSFCRSKLVERQSSLDLRAVLGDVWSDWRMDLFHLQVSLVKSAHRLFLGIRPLLVYATDVLGYRYKIGESRFSIVPSEL